MAKHHYGIATDRYKLIHFYYDVDEWELNDLETDPHKLTNRYNDPPYASMKADWHKQRDALRAQYGDSDENNKKFLNSYPEITKANQR